MSPGELDVRVVRRHLTALKLAIAAPQNPPRWGSIVVGSLVVLSITEP